MTKAEEIFEELISTIEKNAVDNKASISNVELWAGSWRNELDLALNMHVVIKRIGEYAPDKIELPEFDLTKKSDYVYCIEWGEKKAKRNEWEIYQKLLKEMKEKYVL